MEVTADKTQPTTENAAPPPMGWATTRTGKTYHFFKPDDLDGKTKAFCHWGLTPAPGVEFAELQPGPDVACPTCLARFKSWKHGQEPEHWTQPKQEEPALPTQLASGVRVEITARSHKGQYGTVMTEDDVHVGFWYVEVMKNGKRKEWMFSAGQLVIKK